MALYSAAEAQHPTDRYEDLEDLAASSASSSDDDFPLKPYYQTSTTTAEPQRRRQRRRRIGGAITSRPWLTFILGFLSALIPCAIIVSNPGQYLPDACPSTSSTSSPPLPPPPQAQVKVQPDMMKTVNTTFSAFPHKEMNVTATEAWNKLYAAPNQGMLYLQNEATSTSPAAHDVLGVSMFHALHCLGMIRNLVTNSTASTTSEPEHGAHGQPGVDDGVGDDSHISHCFFYIAQTLTCGADGTLEPPSPVLDPSGFFVVDHAVDGNAHTHVCRDASVLWDVALKSHKQPVQDWGWREGDSVQSVFDS